MKVVYLVSSMYRYSGIERVLSVKMNYFVNKYGYDILIITTDQGGRKPFYELDVRIRQRDLNLNYQELQGKTFPHRKYLSLKKNRKYKKILQKIIMDEKPDILVSVTGPEIFFIDEISGNCPTIMEFHSAKKFYGVDLRKNQKNPLRRVLSFWRKKRLEKYSKLFDRVVVLTKEEQQIWEQTNSNVYQIYNPLPFKSEAIAPLDSKNIISVGRLSAEKNHESLIRAWKIVQAKHPDWTLSLWGDGELKEYLNMLIRNCGVQNTFLLRGVTKNIQTEYLKSSAFVLSSICEGFSMVLAEASSYGLPLLSYASECGPRDIIEDGKSGLLVRLNDENGLADAICRIIEDELMRKEMGLHAKKRSSSFAAEKILPQWHALFNEMSYL